MITCMNGFRNKFCYYYFHKFHVHRDPQANENEVAIDFFQEFWEAPGVISSPIWEKGRKNELFYSLSWRNAWNLEPHSRKVKAQLVTNDSLLLSLLRTRHQGLSLQWWWSICAITHNEFHMVFMVFSWIFQIFLQFAPDPFHFPFVSRCFVWFLGWIFLFSVIWAQFMFLGDIGHSLFGQGVGFSVLSLFLFLGLWEWLKTQCLFCWGRGVECRDWRKSLL